MIEQGFKQKSNSANIKLVDSIPQNFIRKVFETTILTTSNNNNNSKSQSLKHQPL